MSEVAISSHRPLHSGKHASGPSQDRDQTTPFEALLDTNTPDPAPKRAPKADKAERPAPSRRANQADNDPRDPPAANAETDAAPDAAAPADGTQTQADAKTDKTDQPADTGTEPSQTAKTDETADALVAIVEPAVQPVVGPVIATAIVTPPLATDAAASTKLTGVTPIDEATAQAAAKAATQAAPVETATPDQTPDDIKAQAAKASAEKSATDKPAADKTQLQSATGEDKAALAHNDTAPAQKKTATPTESSKAEAAEKPKIDPDARHADPDLSPRDHAARPAADTTQSGALSTQTQATHSVANAPSAEQPQQATQTVPVAGLAVEIATQARAGKNRFEIRLDPPELGRIDVRLDMDKDGNVTSRLLVERSDTLDLLRRDAHQLERALNDAGLKTAGTAMEFTLRDQGFANNNNRDGARDGTQHLIIPDDESPVLEAARGYGRRLGLGNGLDISV